MINRFLECGVLLRTYTMFASALYSATALTQPETLLFKVAHANDFATLTMYALGIFAVLGVVDLAINDLLPERFVLSPALRDRHLVSMGIAGCFGIQMWTCVHYGMPLAALPFYAVYVLLVPASAFSDVRKRYKNKACT
jgi:hypothetical protein